MIYHRDGDYYMAEGTFSGAEYTFIFTNAKDQDSLAVTAEGVARSQFRIIINDQNGDEVRSYWATEGANCVHSDKINAASSAQIGSIYIAERIFPAPISDKPPCAVYDPNALENRDNMWYDESELKWDDKFHLYWLANTYHGVDYSFSFTAGVKGLDILDCPAVGKDGGPQFKLKVKGHYGEILRSYWVSQNTYCYQPTPFDASQVGSVVVSERCYDYCSDDLENP